MMQDYMVQSHTSNLAMICNAIFVW